MVTKAIERAQTTVEARNAEIRKNVLKYDEVMNEQRKVIYAKRTAILAGADLKAQLVESFEAAVNDAVNGHCVSDIVEEWDIEALHGTISGYYPTHFTTGELRQARSKQTLIDSFITEAMELYEERENELGPDVARDVERNILLSIVDQRWREHLAEMDYLQEGINLRAMGQKDPLVEWQREGFEMFGRMIAEIDDDFVRYAMLADVVVEAAPAPLIQDLQLHAADESNIGGFGLDVGEMFAATAPELQVGATADDGDLVQRVGEPAVVVQTPIVKSEHEKLGRNEPCFCGSGKKFKNCHGK